MPTIIQGRTGNIDPILTNLTLGREWGEFIAEQVLPVYPVFSRTGTLVDKGTQGIAQVDDTYKGGTVPNSITQDSKTFSYQCTPHGLESPVTDDDVEEVQANGASAVLTLETDAAEDVDWHLRMMKEVRTSDLVMNPDNYDSTMKIALTGTAKWSDDDADIISQFNVGKEAVRKNVGRKANQLVCNQVAFDRLCAHPKIKALLGTNRDQVASIDDLKRLLKLEYIHVGTFIQDDGDGTTSDVWPDNYASLRYLAPEKSRRTKVAMHGCIFDRKKKEVVCKIYDDRAHTTFVQKFMEYDVRVINNKFAYLFTGVLS